jgi:hypothetical protein
VDLARFDMPRRARLTNDRRVVSVAATAIFTARATGAFYWIKSDI